MKNIDFFKTATYKKHKTHDFNSEVLLHMGIGLQRVLKTGPPEEMIVGWSV